MEYFICLCAQVEMLQLCYAQVVVVSRWFGGILLGPDRFKHINNAARSLLNTCGLIRGAGQSGSLGDKQKSQSKAAVHKGIHPCILFDYFLHKELDAVHFHKIHVVRIFPR